MKKALLVILLLLHQYSISSFGLLNSTEKKSFETWSENTKKNEKTNQIGSKKIELIRQLRLILESKSDGQVIKKDLIFALENIKESTNSLTSSFEKNDVSFINECINLLNKLEPNENSFETLQVYLTQSNFKKPESADSFLNSRAYINRSDFLTAEPSTLDEAANDVDGLIFSNDRLKIQEFE